MTTAEPSLDLIDRARQGDRQALDEVVRQWSPRVRRFARRLCPATEVLDAVQESLLVLSTRLGSLRSSQALVSWSFQIVKRHCIKVTSRVNRDSALARTLGPLAEEPSYGDHREAWLTELGRVVAVLPLRDREILVLREFEELTGAQVAVRLGLSEAAVKSRLHRARNQLRQALRESPLARSLPGW